MRPGGVLSAALPTWQKKGEAAGRTIGKPRGAGGRGVFMRLFLRLLGTWLLGVALILLIIDGTRSLGAKQLVFTSLAENWTWLNAESLAVVREFLASRFFGLLLEPVSEAILAFPGWAVLAVPGALLAWAGRSRRTRLFIKHDQI